MEPALRNNPDLAALLDGFAAIGLPDCWIVAGAVAQTLWNAAHGFPPGHGILDIDIIYHDGADLSAAAEAAHEARLRSIFPDLVARLDVKNQARVHLWYKARFGRAIGQYRSSAEAIATFPATATAIGVRPMAGKLAITAPFGTADLDRLIIRPNRRIVSEAVYTAKAARWRAIWPRLAVLDWHAPG
ncbi:MAG: nucleotidyltransferase family protein [Alphaproteobacteria bacterium]|nr:nucleotidyltransferase family protein [Alphaproteobacteria bacterium]